MRRQGALALVAVALAIAGAIAASVALVLQRDLSHPPAVPPGLPVVSSASFSPPIHLFGDVVVARVGVEADRTRVVTASIRLQTRLQPYARVGPIRVHRITLGRVERLEYTLRLVCLQADCTLSTPSTPQSSPPTQKTFQLPPATISYRPEPSRGRQAAVRTPWPALTVATRIASSRPNDFAFTTDFDLPTPSYAVDPGTLVALLIVIGLALMLLPPAVALRRVARRVLRRRRGRRLTALERALLLLDWATPRAEGGDRRRALELVALELAREGEPALAERSRALAWSRPEPDSEVTAAIGVDVRRATVTDGRRPR